MDKNIKNTLHCKINNWDAVLYGKHKLKGVVTHADVKAIRAELRKALILRQFQLSKKS